MNRKQRNALTLVEVVLGMFLLATLLVAMLSAFHSHRTRIRLAGQRLEAADVVDQLLAEWMSAPTPLPLNQTGTWEQRWLWRTRLAGRTSYLSLPVNVVALEIYDAKRPQSDALLTLEVADHVPERAP